MRECTFEICHKAGNRWMEGAWVVLAWLYCQSEAHRQLGGGQFAWQGIEPLTVFSSGWRALLVLLQSVL